MYLVVVQNDVFFATIQYVMASRLQRYVNVSSNSNCYFLFLGSLREKKILSMIEHNVSFNGN